MFYSKLAFSNDLYMIAISVGATLDFSKSIAYVTPFIQFSIKN